MESLPLLLLVGAAVALMFFMSRRNRAQQTKQSEFRDNLEPGQQVMTSSGQLGRVVETEEGAIVIETTPGVYTRWVKAAITSVPPQFAAALESEGDGEDDDADYDDDVEYEDDDAEYDDDGAEYDDDDEYEDDDVDDESDDDDLADDADGPSEVEEVEVIAQVEDADDTVSGADDDKPTTRG